MHVYYSLFSGAHHQARPLHPGNNPTDVQDPGPECSHSGVLAVGAVPRRNQILRLPSNPSGPTASRLFPLHLQVKSESSRLIPSLL